MIQLSRRGAVIYQLLSLIVMLLLLHAAGFLLSALLEMPGNPLQGRLDERFVQRFAEACFKLLLLTALLAGGIVMQALRFDARRTRNLTLAWHIMVAIGLMVSPALPDDLRYALFGLFSFCLLLLSLWRGDRSAFARVWQASLLLGAIGSLAAAFATGTAGEALRHFLLHGADAIGGMSLAFWLLSRFRLVEREWALDGLRITAALVLFAGALASLAQFGLPPLISLASIPLVLLAYMNLASWLIRGISRRDADASLASHWIGLAALFWLISGGFLGALSLPQDINFAMRGTALLWARDWLQGLALLAVICALVNATASELRGEERRVTGYVPLWLISFGGGLAGILAAGRGMLQIYLRDIFGLDATTIRALQLPLTALWLIGLLAVALGIMAYALGFWARRPRIRVVEG